MKVPMGIGVGACSHSGLVRGSNEDDYLVAMLPGDSPVFLAAIADGMGGAAGGAEASRTALRALGTTLLDTASELDADQRMQRGFRLANTRVSESAAAVPALRDMGTTLTALWLDGQDAVLGHIGDTRLYRLRGDVCESLTTDHAVTEGQSLLTKCIGGGQAECDAEGDCLKVSAGDRFVLCSDGVWNVIPPDEFVEIVGDRDAQATAEWLVKRALDHGGPDNATAVIIDILNPHAQGSTEADLPRFERPDARSLWPASASLRPSFSAWLVLVTALVLLLYSSLRWVGIDALRWFSG